MSTKETCDIVVIGAGSAAFEAAVAARQNGAERVIMLEKAPEERSGGNARFSHTGFRFVNTGSKEIRDFIPDVPKDVFDTMHLPPYTRDDLVGDLNRVTQGRIDPVLADYMADSSNEALHWMLDTGITWNPEKTVLVDGKRYFEPGTYLHPKGGGPGQLRQWRKIADKLGIEVRFLSKVTKIHGDHRRVEGVHVATTDGRDYDLMARAVIACSGGFQASPEMRARYLSINSDFVKVRGSRYNTGEVLRMMVDLGARTSGHWQMAHMSPIDAGAPAFETPVREDGTGNTMNRYDYQLGITVNSSGERFYDEGEASHVYTYAKTGRAVLSQPGGIAYQIYDKKGIALFHFNNDGKATHFLADSIPELAKKIGIVPEVLTHTVNTFNKAVRDDIPFDKSRMDGRRTEGLSPNKSNWSLKIDEPPFQASPVTCGITFTFGGVNINTRAQVMNNEGEPIKGLFASGDVVGLFFHNYPACTGQTRNVVFGLTAGRNAMKESN
jgi:tricarballylate dehydrogenase